MFQRALRQRTWEIGRTKVAIRMAEDLQNLSTSMKAVALKKDSFSDTQNPKTGC